MKTALFLLTAAHLAVAATARADIPAGGLENLNFAGICHLDRGIAKSFTLPVNTATDLAITEIDDLGTEVVTNIQVTFLFGDSLGAGFAAELPPPQVGDAHASDLQLGVRLSAVLPSQLGGQVFCDGKVVKVVAP